MPGTGRRRHRSASVAVARYREGGAVAGLENGRGDGEGRAAGRWTGGVAGRGRGAGVRHRWVLWQRAPISEAGTGGGHARSGLSLINFVGWKWADGRYFNFRHSLRPMKVRYLMPSGFVASFPCFITNVTKPVEVTRRPPAVKRRKRILPATFAPRCSRGIAKLSPQGVRPATLSRACNGLGSSVWFSSARGASAICGEPNLTTGKREFSVGYNNSKSCRKFLVRSRWNSFNCQRSPEDCHSRCHCYSFGRRCCW
jgi:hypothetical protein